MQIEELDQSSAWKEGWKRFKDSPRGFLLFAGSNGTGKTFAAESIYNAIYIPPHLDKFFFTQTDLYIRWQEEMKKWGETSYFMKQLMNAPILVLDDLGTRTPTEAFKDFLYGIIEKRERNKEHQGTIITTNLTGKQVREKFGDAITSRIASGQVFRFEGKDRRFKVF